MQASSYGDTFIFSIFVYVSTSELVCLCLTYVSYFTLSLSLRQSCLFNIFQNIPYDFFLSVTTNNITNTLMEKANSFQIAKVCPLCLAFGKIFGQFQPGVAYKSTAYKSACNLTTNHK